MAKSRYSSSAISLEEGHGPLWRRLYDEIREAIIQGRLQPGDRLMSTRSFAEASGCSRVTVLKAFEQLKIEGYLSQKVGSGTFVNEGIPDQILQVLGQKGEVSKDMRVGEKLDDHFGKFYPGLPDMEEFPFEKWSRVSTSVVRNLPGSSFNQYDRQGFMDLRMEIARHLRKYRGLSVTGDDILITQGITDSLEKMVHSLFRPGDVIWVEDPCYAPARDLFLGLGIEIRPLDLQADPLVFPDVNSEADVPKAIYLTPSHQYPLGGSLSVDKRLQLIEQAEALGALVVEDDYDSVYRFHDAPLRALHGLSSAVSTLYLGSMSKMLFVGLRISFMVLPPAIKATILKYQGLTNKGQSIIEQAILSRFMKKGFLDQHIRKMRLVYAERYKLLLKELKARFASHITVLAATTGIHFVCLFNENLDDQAFVAYVKPKGYHLIALSSLYINEANQRPGFVMGYGNVPTKMIPREMESFAKHFNDWRAQ